MDEFALLKDFRLEDAVADGAREHARAALRAAMTRRRFARRRYALVVAFAVAALLAAAAYAIANEFVLGAPAPPEITHAFAAANERGQEVPLLFRRSGTYDTLAKRARGVIEINSSVGPIIIWAAPTKGGGICWLIDVERAHVADQANGGGGCARELRPRVPIEYGLGRGQVGVASIALLDGRVRHDVASVEVRYADGRREELPVIGGFFLDELRSESHPTLLIARGRNGGELARLSIRRSSPVRAQPPALGPERILIRLHTSDGHELTFGVARDENGQFCEVTHYRGTTSLGCGVDSRDRVAADELAIGAGLWNEAEDGHPLVTLEGVVGAAIARLELRYGDGTIVPVPITDRFVVFEIPPERHGESRFVLRGYNSGGELIANRIVK